MYNTFVYNNNNNISSFRSANNNNNNNKINSLKLSLNTPSKFTIYDSNNKNSRNFYSSNFTYDTSITFSPLKTTNFSLLTLDNKIKLANEKRNKNLEEKKLFFENERKKKEERLMHYYKIFKKNKNLINLNSNNERKRKQLKIKINHIINKNHKKNCESYDNKISSFNIKIFDFLQGNHNTIQNYKYCKNFHFDKNTNNFEAHDRYKMIIDNNNNQNNNEFKNENDMINFKTILNNKEIKMVNEEPAYFFDNNYKYKIKSLTERIIDEEENEKKKKGKNKLLINFNYKKEKKYKEQNIEEKINDVKNIIKHNIYNYKTIELKKTNNDFKLQKILKKMNNEISNIKKQNIINYDIETLKDIFYKSDKKFKNIEKKFLSPQNKRKFNFFDLFNFNQTDQDLIKKYNSLIKNGYKL